MSTPSHQTRSRKLAALALTLSLSGCPNENACPPCYIDYSPDTKSTVYLQVAKEYADYAVAGARIILEDDQGNIEKHELDLRVIILDRQMRQYVMSELDFVGDENGAQGRRPVQAWIDIDFKQDTNAFTVQSKLSLAQTSG